MEIFIYKKKQDKDTEICELITDHRQIKSAYNHIVLWCGKSYNKEKARYKDKNGT